MERRHTASSFQGYDFLHLIVTGYNIKPLFFGKYWTAGVYILLFVLMIQIAVVIKNNPYESEQDIYDLYQILHQT